MHRLNLPPVFICLVLGFMGLILDSQTIFSQNPAQDVQFVEQFALSEDRAKVLEQTVPGTEQYYYFHCLHYLTTEQLGKAEEMLKPWIKRFGRTNRVQLIQNRLAILKYDDDPTQTLEFLRRQLNLNFNHQREIPDTQRDLPTSLDSNLLDINVLTKRAMSRRNTELFTDAGLKYLAEKDLSRTQRRHLLQRLRYPDFNGLVSMIVADLKERDSGGFGKITIHRELTLQQLDRCAEQLPKLRDNNEFVNVYLSKLHPSNDVDWRVDRQARRAYLDRLWKFASPLNPKFNSLKACILYRQLELDRQQGRFDLQKFTTYLKLPRQLGYVNPDLIKAISSRNHLVNLNSDYRAQTLLFPVRNDEQLIQEYLQHFLRDANDESQFRPYVRTNYLKAQMATAKILHGLGDKEKWASMLSPRQYQDLMERIDLDFASTNAEFYRVDQPVRLELFTKNIRNLIVKIYEINTHNYYRKFGKEIDTDISLDGLVPNHEQVFNYTDSPALRIRRKYELDEIRGRGVYVVDFIGNGKSSRALIRKGRMTMIGETTIAGHQFKVVDEAGQQVAKAELSVGGRRFASDDQGNIIVPFTNSPGTQSAIIRSGEFSCLQNFQHQSENYQLRAAMLIDRESLLRSKEAKILIRPRITIAGIPVTTKILENVRLQITSENMDGLNSTRLIKDIQLGTNAETVCKFIVPPRLKKLTLQLMADVKNVSKNKTDNLTTQQSYEINQIDRSDEIQDVHLVPYDEGYALEVTGKTGESRYKQAVRIRLSVRGFTEPVTTDLQSNQEGRILLGKLPNVTVLKATLSGGSERTWSFLADRQSHYQTIHALEGQTIEIPSIATMQPRDRSQLSLFEVRRRTNTREITTGIQIKDGVISISELSRGDYRLRFKDIDRVINIRVTQGKPFENVLIGQSRQLETRGGAPVYISEIEANKTQVKLKLENVNDWTRVHLVGTRYAPRFGSYGIFTQIRDVEPAMYQPPVRRSVYMAGRKIGDEYQYILDRKYANKYAGSMLQRPSLLLNPWELRSTQNKVESLESGADYGTVGTEADKAPA